MRGPWGLVRVLETICWEMCRKSVIFDTFLTYPENTTLTHFWHFCHFCQNCPWKRAVFDRNVCFDQFWPLLTPLDHYGPYWTTTGPLLDPTGPYWTLLDPTETSKSSKSQKSRQNLRKVVKIRENPESNHFFEKFRKITTFSRNSGKCQKCL